MWNTGMVLEVNFICHTERVYRLVGANTERVYRLVGEKDLCVQKKNPSSLVKSLKKK